MRREINYIPREKPHLVTRTLPEVALNVLRANCVLAEGNWGVTRLGATNCQNLFPFTALIAAFFPQHPAQKACQACQARCSYTAFIRI